MNHERYRDPTADMAIRNIEREEKNNMVDTMTVYRGDIFYINKSGYAVGSEQESGRPAVIVSNDTGNVNSTCVEIVYLTTQKKDKAYLPTHVSVVARVKSTAICEQIFTVSKERLGEYVRSCTEKEMKAIDKALMISLGIEVGGAAENTPEPAEAPAKIDEITPSACIMTTKEVKLEAERDLYKKLYDYTLERLSAG